MRKKAFSMKQTWLECIGCGRIQDLLAERKFRCPKCNDLFEIKHNFSPFIDAYTGKGLKSEFEGRKGIFRSTFEPWEMSGVWRYRELIMPYLPTEYIVSLGEGNVPILPAGKKLMRWLGTDQIKVWIILEGMTPTGSFKDFGGTVMISTAKAAGVEVVVCASTGDTSAMAAAYAAPAGMKCTVILPEGKVTAVQLAQPFVHGAKVITLPGSFDDCMRVVQDLVLNHGAYPANSLNPARIEGHQATAFQIAQFFNWKMPDWIAVPVGNGSNSSSIGKGMRLMHGLGITEECSRILGCQSMAANPLSSSWNRAQTGMSIFEDAGHANLSLEHWRNNYQPVQVGETTATAARIGNPVSREKVMREVVNSKGAMKTVSELDLNEAVAVCGQDGIFVCPQTGTALAGVRDAIADGKIQPGQTVVVVSTATGLKFTDSAARYLKKEIIKAPDCETDTVRRIIGM